MSNNNEYSDVIIIQKQFLCGVPVKNIIWQNIFQDITWNKQEYLINKTVNLEIVLKYPIKISYQKVFIKFIIEQLVKNNSDVHDCVYDSYGRIVALPDGNFHYYKHYVNNCGKFLSLKENANFISQGTTGLCTWQASIAFSEWCLHNPKIFNRKTILELGAGVGFTGLTIALNCNPYKVYLTDCHKSVLNLLCDNVQLNCNLNKIPDGSDKNFVLKASVNNNHVEVVNLPWECVNTNLLNAFDTIDVVVATDVVYDKDLFESLINAVRCLLIKYCCQVFFACTERNKETLKEFLKILENYGVASKELELVPPNNYIWNTDTEIKLFSLEKL